MAQVSFSNKICPLSVIVNFPFFVFFSSGSFHKTLSQDIVPLKKSSLITYDSSNSLATVATF